MNQKSIVTVIAVGIVAFVCGTFSTQPTQAQKRPGQSAVATGRFSLVAVSKDRYCVIDATDGHTWAKVYTPDTGWVEWADEGIPSERAKRR